MLHPYQPNPSQSQNMPIVWMDLMLGLKGGGEGGGVSCIFRFNVLDTNFQAVSVQGYWMLLHSP